MCSVFTSAWLPLSPTPTIAGGRWMLNTYSLNNREGFWVIFPFCSSCSCQTEGNGPGGAAAGTNHLDSEALKSVL